MPPLKKINFLVVDDYSSVRTMVKNHLKEVERCGKIFDAPGVKEGFQILEDNLGGPVSSFVYAWISQDIPFLSLFT